MCSGAGDSFRYDALGRNTRVTHSDGSYQQYAYTGRATQITDEGNGNTTISRILQSDGLGRLTNVCEIYSGSALLGAGGTPASCGLDITGTGFPTSYTYDLLDNLTSMAQGSQVRSFTYDSLSRLVSSQQTEEPGVTTYSYNADSLVYQRTRPAPNQSGAATVTTTYSYDQLHRLTSRTYSDVTIPGDYYYYDQSAPWGFPLSNPMAT